MYKITDILQIEVDFNNQLLIMIKGNDETLNADRIDFDHETGTFTLYTS